MTILARAKEGRKRKNGSRASSIRRAIVQGGMLMTMTRTERCRGRRRGLSLLQRIRKGKTDRRAAVHAIRIEGQSVQHAGMKKVSDPRSVL